MLVYSSRDSKQEIDSLRDKIKSDGFVEMCLNKRLARISNPKTRITKNKFGVFILWVGKR